jgi:hypothetical protein
LKFRLPPPKTTLKAGGEKLQLEKVKKRKKGNMTDSEDSDKSDFRRAWKKYKKAKKKARHEAEAAGLSWKSGCHGTMPAIHLSHQEIAQGFLV